MLVLAVLVLIGSVSSQCLTGNASVATSNSSAEEGLISARFKFALDSLKETSLILSDKNIFYSPYSLYEALSLVYFGSRGTTEQSLKKALNIPDDLSQVDVQRYYALENTKGLFSQAYATDYTSANRLWISDTRKVRECILNLFGDQLVKTDFHNNPDGVRDNINQWISNETKGQIQHLLNRESITTDTDLVLANAVYFKGFWHNEFNPVHSKKDLFYSSGSQHSRVTFMHQTGLFTYHLSMSLNSQILKLPYKGDRISMFVILPAFATDGIRALIDRLSTDGGSAELRRILDSSTPTREVEVYLPRFTDDERLPTRRLLHALGVGDLNSADLSGFIEEGEQPLHLGDVVHRARIEVTEEGTTAAGVTVTVVGNSVRLLPPPVFNANRPFVYMLYDSETKAILFTGVYRSPSLPRNTTETSA